MCWQSTLFYQVKVILFQSSPSNIDVWLFRETNDAEEDTETIHTIKKIFYRDPSDIAIIELHASVNNCSDSSKCWKINPVNLPLVDVNIRINQTVRTLGNFNEIFSHFTFKNGEIKSIFHCFSSFLELKANELVTVEAPTGFNINSNFRLGCLGDWLSVWLPPANRADHPQHWWEAGSDRDQCRAKRRGCL